MDQDTTPNLPSGYVISIQPNLFFTGRFYIDREKQQIRPVFAPWVKPIYDDVYETKEAALQSCHLITRYRTLRQAMAAALCLESKRKKGEAWDIAIHEAGGNTVQHAPLIRLRNMMNDGHTWIGWQSEWIVPFPMER